MGKVKLIECPRDAMQGIKKFIPTETKVKYINFLLEIGFDTIDVGSFVSPQAIPQMADTALVLSKLNWSPAKSKLLAIVANKRGAMEACMFDEIAYLGFPFSVSETFQLRNTNATREDALARVQDIQNLCIKHHKTLVLYLSMGFGNPYGDPWNEEIVMQYAGKVTGMGITVISLADTIGVADPENIAALFDTLIPAFPDVEFGAHFHTTPSRWREKIETAFDHGCRRFDGALKGFGGCPMAADDLTGNMPTENILSFLGKKNIDTEINQSLLLQAMAEADEVFLK